MPLDRLALIIVCVIGAAGFTIWVATSLLFANAVNPLLALPILAIVAMVIYVVWRLLAERLNNPDEDHYDNMDH